uniref:DOMON domain-containing protein n=1 Tax=Kryptolebias marmoratus TaxID=37003 RepID=A0A3Q3AID2_KRYMA
MSALLSFLFISLAWTKATWASDYNLTHTVSLDAKVSLKWGFNDPKGNITFQLKISTTGWVGFGLGLHDNMVNADIVVGGLGSNGSYFLQQLSFIWACDRRTELPVSAVGQRSVHCPASAQKEPYLLSH